MKIIFIGSKMSENINYQSDTEVIGYATEILSELFKTLRILLRTNSQVLKNIDERYEREIGNFINYIPLNLFWHIFKTYETLRIYMTCIDIRKMIVATTQMDIRSFEFDIRSYVDGFVIGKLTKAKEKNYMTSLIGKLNPVFDCVEYILANPREILKNAEVFIEIQDVVF